jgi:hypothetical protein
VRPSQERKKGQERKIGLFLGGGTSGRWVGTRKGEMRANMVMYFVSTFVSK